MLTIRSRSHGENHFIRPPADPLPKSYLVAPILLFLGLLIGFGAALHHLAQMRKVEEWPLVVGEISGVYEKKFRTSKGKPSSKTVHTVRYTVDGKIHEREISGSAVPGTTMALYLNPSDPQEWYVKTSTPPWTPALILAALVTSALVITLAWLLARYRRHKAAEWLLSNGIQIMGVVREVRTITWKRRNSRRVRITGNDVRAYGSERSDYQVVAQSDDPRAREREFESYRLREHPGEIEGYTIPITIHPDEAETYYLGAQHIAQARPQ